MSGNYQEAVNDATAAVNLEPTSIEAIETGKIIGGHLWWQDLTGKAYTISADSSTDSIDVLTPVLNRTNYEMKSKTIISNYEFNNIDQSNEDYFLRSVYVLQVFDHYQVQPFLIGVPQ